MNKTELAALRRCIAAADVVFAEAHLNDGGTHPVRFKLTKTEARYLAGRGQVASWRESVAMAQTFVYVVLASGRETRP